MELADILRAAMLGGKILRAAIIDDAYDPPEFESLAAGDVALTRNNLRDLDDEEAPAEAKAALAAIEQAAGIDIAAVTKRLREAAILKPLWALHQGDGATPQVRAALAPIFRALAVDQMERLKPLDALRKLLTDAGVEVETFGSVVAAQDFGSFDLIFLDYFLSRAVPVDPLAAINDQVRMEARQRSIDFLNALVRKDPTNIPLVMLISTAGVHDDLPAFREGAQMLASKMEFLPKTIAANDETRTVHAIVALANQREQADTLWTLLRTWQTAVNAASESLLTSIRQVDLLDYSYMQEFRLKTEKTSLADYLTWLFNGKLVDLVERHLEQAGVRGSINSVQLPESIVGRLAPSEAVADIYASLTTTLVPAGDARQRPMGWSGDVYVDTATYNRIFGVKRRSKKSDSPMPQVLAVVTPSCDLVVGRSDKLRSVTMIGGHLIPLEEESDPTTHFLVLNKQPYVVSWEPKWPVTCPIEEMKGDRALGGRYHRVARLRDIYHAELQHKLMSDVSRIGLPVPPVMSKAVGFKVLAKVDGGAYQEVFSRPVDRAAAWTFASKGKRAFCIRSEVAWDVRDAIRNGVANANTLQRTERPEFIDELQKPILFSPTSASKTSGSSTIVFKKVPDIAAETGAGMTNAVVVIFETPAAVDGARAAA